MSDNTYTPSVIPAPDAVASANEMLPSINVTTTPIRPRVNKPPTKPAVVERTETTPPFDSPSEALQTAEPINTPVLSAFILDAAVLVDGFNLGPPVSMEVSTNGYYQADRYYVELALAAFDDQHQEAFWCSGNQKKIELRVMRDSEKPKSLILGLVDDCEIDWSTRIIKLRGRDLTSLLLDNKTAEKFTNKTASDVAEIIATRRGLSSKITKTSTIVGVYFQREHAKLSMDITEHDLLTFLAEQEGFNYWVEGSTLHFEAPPPENSKPFVINYTPPTRLSIANGTFIALNTKRNETLAKDIEVICISWHGKKQSAIRATAKRSRTRGPNDNKISRNTVGGGAARQAYVYRFNGLSQEQLQARANKLAEEISKHERTVRCEMPYDPIMDARTRVSLRGTKTEFDQPYFVDSIEYSFSYEGGTRMEIHMRNNAPQSQVSIV